MIQKYLKVSFAAAALCLLGFWGCTETSELEEVVLPAPVEETSGFPRVPVKVDSTLTLKVLYRPANGCGRFERADSLVNGQTTTLTIFAAYPTEDQEAICADISKQVAFTFRFRTKAVGKHYFRFWQSDTSFLLDSIVVQ
ncbi:hypothetical protein ACFSC6_00735 [Rufibacter sediminis]|uniref:Proteinase inhibitor I42 chagasin domain-containing protein n=1 Tax=Rufibacter sediminis TaxID=2762756 RepID=A0ABR6VMJ5_9BACT|nr:hypothetical protein [Rufibacter sediminis]MBC3538125.1 hypothetical protein [Rufibacter sediminis]